MKYTFLQKLRAAMMNVNVEWLYSTEVERMIMRFKSLSEEELQLLNQYSK